MTGLLQLQYTARSAQTTRGAGRFARLVSTAGDARDEEVPMSGRRKLIIGFAAAASAVAAAVGVARRRNR